MSRPGGPYRDERGRPYQQQHQGYPQDQYQGGYPGQGGYDQQRGYDRQREYAEQRGYDQRPPAPRESEGGGFRLPGLGLLLSLLGLVVQALSLLVLPWSTGEGTSTTLPEVWELLKDVRAEGFSGSYVLLFSYPLAVLGVLLSLVAVIESVAMKIIWAALTLIGIAVLVLRFGLGPFGEMIVGDNAPLVFSRQEITIALIALAALVLVIFMLKMAMSTFRRIAGLVLLVIAGVHIAALDDFGGGLDSFSIGAYGPVLGYVLAAAAAFVGPRRLA